MDRYAEVFNVTSSQCFIYFSWDLVGNKKNANLHTCPTSKCCTNHWRYSVGRWRGTCRGVYGIEPLHLSLLSELNKGLGTGYPGPNPKRHQFHICRLSMVIKFILVPQSYGLWHLWLCLQLLLQMWANYNQKTGTPPCKFKQTHA